MNIDPKSELAKGFVTTVGIVSSRGKHGNNLMAAEWTYLVSYSPAMITVHIGNRKSKATAENITETGVFGVSLAATHQNVITSIIGNNKMCIRDSLHNRQIKYCLLRQRHKDIRLPL